MLKVIALLDSVAEKSFTGMETSPKEIVSDAMERAARIVSFVVDYLCINIKDLAAELVSLHEVSGGVQPPLTV